MQYPWLVQDWYASVEEMAYTHEDFKTLHNVIAPAFETSVPEDKEDLNAWYEKLILSSQNSHPSLKKLIAELTISETKISLDETIEQTFEQRNAYPTDVIKKLLDNDAKRRLEALKIEQSQTTDDEEYFAITLTIMEMEKYRKALK